MIIDINFATAAGKRSPRGTSKLEKQQMRMPIRILRTAATLAVLCAGLAAFAQDKRFSMVPDNASMVVNVNYDVLYSCPTFQPIAESGEFWSPRNDLKEIPWNESGSLPDPLVVFSLQTGLRYAMLVDTETDTKDLAARIADRYKNKKSIETKQYGIGELLNVQRPKTDKKTKKQYLKTESQILCLGPRTAAFGRENHPIDLDLFSRGTLPPAVFAPIRDLPDNVAAAGLILRYPLRTTEDLTGLAALADTGDFTLSEVEPGVAQFTLHLNCKGEKEAAAAARRLKSVVRIAFVTLFAADRSLFREIKDSYRTESSGTRATLEIRLPLESLVRIRAFYLADRSIVSAATATIKTPGDSGK